MSTEDRIFGEVVVRDDNLFHFELAEHDKDRKHVKRFSLAEYVMLEVLDGEEEALTLTATIEQFHYSDSAKQEISWIVGRVLDQSPPVSKESPERLAKPFRCALRKIKQEEVRSYLESYDQRLRDEAAKPPKKTFIPLEVGVVKGHKVPPLFFFDADGFGRHTGWFGQSGSGKSFAIGILLERFIAKLKNARVVVFDLNGDFTGLDTPVSQDEFKAKNRDFPFGYWSDYQKELEKVTDKKTVFRTLNFVKKEDSSYILFGDLDASEKAALFRLDPAIDRDLYHKLVETTKDSRSLKTIADLKNALKPPIKLFKTDETRLQHLYDNLDIESMNIWGGTQSAADVLNAADWQFLILDLSGLKQNARCLVASVLLRGLYKKNFDCWVENSKDDAKPKPRPTIVVVDEAHNLFPSEPEERLQQLTLEQGCLIAGEGRKYGVFLVVSSQLPSKMSGRILTECANLVLMKMSSDSDIEMLQGNLSFINEDLLSLSKLFSKGEALVAGKIVERPTIIKFTGRLTKDKGDDLQIE